MKGYFVFTRYSCISESQMTSILTVIIAPKSYAYKFTFLIYEKGRRKMKRRKHLLFIQYLIIMLLVVGCGQQVIVDNNGNSTEEGLVEVVPTEQPSPDSENVNIVSEENMSSDFYLVIEDTFSLVDRNDLVVTGVNENSALCTGAQVDVISSTGRIQTQVLGIEEAYLGNAKSVDSVESGSNVGVMLAGVTKEQVNAGDLLVLRDQGLITDEVTALVAAMPVDDGQIYAEVTEGQNVQVIMFDRPIEATVMFVESLSEEDGIVLIDLKFAEMIACQNYQELSIHDENDNTIAVGRFIFSD